MARIQRSLFLIPVLVVACAVLALAKYDLTKSPKQLWGLYKTQNKLVFAGQEDARRFQVFQKQILEVKKLQKGNDGAKYDLGVLAHFDEAEWQSLLGSFAPAQTPKRGLEDDDGMKRAELDELEGQAVPASRDWRRKILIGGKSVSRVSSVKNQGRCGCCWAFAAAAAIECARSIKHTVVPVNVSPQQFIDCVTASNGCNGGRSTDAFSYTQRNGGVHTLASYPFAAAKRTCRKFSGSIGAKVSSFAQIGFKSYSGMLSVVGLKQPVVALVDASYWRYYTGGISSKGSTDPMRVNHSVLVVGYGKSSSGIPYWIVKNSWGSGWGSGGYILVRRSSTANYQSLHSWGSYPVSA